MLSSSSPSPLPLLLSLLLLLLPLPSQIHAHPPLTPTPTPTPTPAPTPVHLVARQNTSPNGLIGWFTDPAAHTWTSSACPAGMTYTTEGRFGGCCSSTRAGAANPGCALATGCADNIAVFPDGGSGVCRNNQQCESITIRIDATGLAAQTMISCIDTADIFSTPNTLWRQTFTITTPVSTVTATQTATHKETATATTATGPDGESGGDEGGAVGGGIRVGSLVVGAAGVVVAMAMAL